jgi:hypothetical protein
MLYSFQSQEPNSLPGKVRLPDGSTRSSLAELSDGQLLELGFTGPYTEPSYDSATEKITWDSENLQYNVVALTQNELDAIADRNYKAIADSIRYTDFWNSIIVTQVYQKIRLQASQNLPATTALTELIAAITDAKYGRYNIQAIQASINLVISSLTLDENDLAEIVGAMVQHNLHLIYTLPTPPA